MIEHLCMLRLVLTRGELLRRSVLLQLQQLQRTAQECRLLMVQVSAPAAVASPLAKSAAACVTPDLARLKQLAWQVEIGPWWHQPAIPQAMRVSEHS
jgi:hypothetical protein